MKDLEYLNETCKCPDCDSPDFSIGPSGGMAVNIRCGGCGAKYWFAPPFAPYRIDNDDILYPRGTVNLFREVYGMIEPPPPPVVGTPSEFPGWFNRVMSWMRGKR